MRAGRKMMVAAAVVLSGVSFALSVPVAAQADSGTISGGMPECNVNYYYTAARTNTHPHNIVEFSPSDYPCGGTFTLGLRSSKAPASSFAKATWGLGYKEFVSTSGSTSLAAGTFYLTSYADGTCGAGCPSGTKFTGTLIWNESAQ